MKRNRKPQDIRRYGSHIVIMNWVFLILISSLIYSGLVLLQDILFEHLNIIGGPKPLPVFIDAELYHLYLGIGTILFGAAHILMHITQKEKLIIPKSTTRGMKAVLHTLAHILFLAKRDERGSAEKYKNNVQMAYLAIVYIIGLTSITGMLIYFNVIKGYAISIHLALGCTVVLFAIYWLVYTIRKHDIIALKCSLMTGTMPEWYVKKNYYNWYKSVKGGYKTPPELNYEVGSKLQRSMKK